ncbi:hypothetical protein INT44_008038 [Umbelopsis vinacea]|uniref:Uncharacterized protein n=1 Tax=Umbelopsis vinacea TaxID=44442 RepID=A0A8H7PNX3_9FUNG|nr:hypothetical protein INT44_008038 [Umbelopsis vinacea]
MFSRSQPNQTTNLPAAVTRARGSLEGNSAERRFSAMKVGAKYLVSQYRKGPAWLRQGQLREAADRKEVNSGIDLSTRSRKVREIYLEAMGHGILKPWLVPAGNSRDSPSVTEASVVIGPCIVAKSRGGYVYQGPEMMCYASTMA